MRLRQVIPNLLGAALLLFSGSFVVFNVLKYNMGLGIPFDPFAPLMERAGAPVWSAFWNGLIIGGPLAAFLLFLASALEFDLNFKKVRLADVLEHRHGRLALILMAACAALFAVYCLYFVGENLPCLLGRQLAC